MPLLRQTWLCKKKGLYVALKILPDRALKKVRFQVVSATTEKELGFNPAGFSSRGNATCPFCGSNVPNGYVKSEGKAGRIGVQMMAVVCARHGQKGKVYLSANELNERTNQPDNGSIQDRIKRLCDETDLTIPEEKIFAAGLVPEV
ncbi:hypothetical protein SY88_22875 [Clostridiales bacterium PH28_bin88]|nr:hypothetical protein SY88_22875 [Clostridiales bacterium PH28_bin88]